MFKVRTICVLLLAACGLLLGPAAVSARQDTLGIFNLIPTNIEAMGYNGDILYALISTLEKEKNIKLYNAKSSIVVNQDSARYKNIKKVIGGIEANKIAKVVAKMRPVAVIMY